MLPLRGDINGVQIVRAHECDQRAVRAEGRLTFFGSVRRQPHGAIGVERVDVKIGADRDERRRIGVVEFNAARTGHTPCVGRVDPGHRREGRFHLGGVEQRPFCGVAGIDDEPGRAAGRRARHQVVRGVKPSEIGRRVPAEVDSRRRIVDLVDRQQSLLGFGHTSKQRNQHGGESDARPECLPHGDQLTAIVPQWPR